MSESSKNNTEHKGNWLTKNAVNISGMGGAFANAGLFVDGYLRDDKALMVSSIAGIAPIILAVYGNGDKGAEFDRMVEDMRLHFEKEGINVPPSDFKKQKSNALGIVDDFLKEHPIEISSGISILGTAALWWAGWNEFQKDGKITKLATATTTLIGYATMMAVPEESPLKKPEEGKGFNFKFNPMAFHAGLNLVDIGCWASEVLEDTFEGRVLPELNVGGKDIFANLPQGRHHKLQSLKTDLEGLYNGYDKSFNLGHVTGLNERKEQLNKLSEDQHLQKSEITSHIADLEKRIHDKQIAIDYLDKPEELIFGIDKAQASGYAKAAIAAGFTVNILMNFLAHKNKSAEEMLADYDKVFEASAKMLQKMPESQRDMALDQMVTFLSVNKSMAQACMDPLEIKENIEKKVTELSKAPKAANEVKPFKRVNSNDINLQGKAVAIEQDKSFAMTH
jgi:hypothetical protein